MAWEVIVEHAGITVLIHTIQKLRRVRFLRYRLIRPSSEIRVALSAVIRIHEGGKYVLVQNLHRPETFAPFGGVYKYHDHALPTLDILTFRPEDLGPGTDMKNDLRGYIPRGNLLTFLTWFTKAEGRETTPECLKRELAEEIREIGPSGKLTVPRRLQFRHVRTVEEGPEIIPGMRCAQYRIFEVYEPIGPNYGQNFFKKLFRIALSHKRLVVVDTSEIVKGRARDGRVIAHHADYLIGCKRIHPDERPMQNGFEETVPPECQ